MSYIIPEKSKITELISCERLNSYRYDMNDDLSTIYRRYLYNLKISESFYPIISVLEIALRNRLFNGVSMLKGDNWLVNEINTQNVLSKNERDILIAANNKLFYKHKGNVTSGMLIAELTFGFWVNLCKKSYKNSLWDKPKFFQSVFPDFDLVFSTTNLDKTKVIFPLLKDILRLRNRLFHHEIIINNKQGIDNCYDTIYKVLLAVSEEYAYFFSPIFRFEDVIKQKPR